MQDHMSYKDYRMQVAEDLPEIGVSPKPKSPKKKPQTTLNPLEKDIQKAILERLAFVKNSFFWRQNSGAMVVKGLGGVNDRFFRAGFPGISDILGLYKGIFVAIEVKRPGEKPRPNQEAFLQRVKEAGGITIVCDDDREVVKQLEQTYKEIKYPMIVASPLIIKNATP